MGKIYRTDIIALKKIMIDQGVEKIIDLSNISGIDRNTLSKVMSGDIQPSSNVMDKLVNSLRIPPEMAGRIFFTHNLHNE